MDLDPWRVFTGDGFRAAALLCAEYYFDFSFEHRQNGSRRSNSRTKKAITMGASESFSDTAADLASSS
jgi:hypothetical protein